MCKKFGLICVKLWIRFLIQLHWKIVCNRYWKVINWSHSDYFAGKVSSSPCKWHHIRVSIQCPRCTTGLDSRPWLFKFYADADSQWIQNGDNSVIPTEAAHVIWKLATLCKQIWKILTDQSNFHREDGKTLFSGEKTRRSNALMVIKTATVRKGDIRYLCMLWRMLTLTTQVTNCLRRMDVRRMIIQSLHCNLPTKCPFMLWV